MKIQNLQSLMVNIWVDYFMQVLTTVQKTSFAWWLLRTGDSHGQVKHVGDRFDFVTQSWIAPEVSAIMTLDIRSLTVSSWRSQCWFAVLLAQHLTVCFYPEAFALRQHIENVSKECCFFLDTFFLFSLCLSVSLSLSLWLFLLIPQMWKCVHIIYIYPVSGQFVRAGLLLALSLLIFKGQFIWTIVFKLPQKDWIWIDIWLRRHFSFQLFSLGAFKQNTVHFGQSLLLFYCIFLNSGKESVLSLVCILQYPV